MDHWDHWDHWARHAAKYREILVHAVGKSEYAPIVVDGEVRGVWRSAWAFAADPRGEVKKLVVIERWRRGLAHTDVCFCVDGQEIAVASR